MPRRAALLLTAALLSACGVPHAERDRAAVEARTCASFLRRSGRLDEAARVDPATFLRVRAEFEASGRPYSTLEPFLRACPLRG